MLENIIAPILFFGSIAFLIGFYLYAIIQVHRNKALSVVERRDWINLIYFLPLIGCAYYMYSMKKRKGRSSKKDFLKLKMN